MELEGGYVKRENLLCVRIDRFYFNGSGEESVVEEIGDSECVGLGDGWGFDSSDVFAYVLDEEFLSVGFAIELSVPSRSVRGSGG